MTAAPFRKRRPSDLERAQARAGYLFVLPTSVLYLTFVLAPVALTVILSFSFYDPMLGSRWVGLENYTRFFSDPRSLRIFWNTLRFTFFAVTFNVSVGLLLAVALNRAMPAWLLYFFRLAFFLPVMIASAFAAMYGLHPREVSQSLARAQQRQAALRAAQAAPTPTDNADAATKSS